MANRFWVGGSGNWNDTGHWSTSSGGASGASVPTASDDAIFNAASNATAYTVTINVAACGPNLSSSAAPSGSGTITWAGSSGMTISGSLTMLAGMTRTYTGAIIMNGTGSHTIDTKGIAMASTLNFQGSAVTFTFSD